MKFEIDSSKISFNGEDIKAFLKRMKEACEAHNTSFFVVGAVARNIILEHILGNQKGLATRDIDFAIAIDSWDKYERLTDHLVSEYGFSKTRVGHRLISPEKIITDIIPYGAIEAHRTISFPPDFRTVLNTVGFEEVKSATIEIILDHELAIKIASSESIIVLKFIAWSDREPSSASLKHVQDIYLILNAYFLGKVDEIFQNFPDLLDAQEFDEIVCSAKAVGRIIKQMSGNSPELIQTLDEIFSAILEDEENSLFINQLVTISNRPYPFCLRVIKSLILAFEKFK